MIKSALAECVISSFPLNELITFPEVPPKYVQYSTDDLRLLLTQARLTSINYLGMLLCLLTGLRIGEVRGLAFSNIDFEQHTITVCQQITDRTALYINKRKSTLDDYIKPPKSKASYRTLKVPDVIIEELHIRQ